MIGLFPRLLRKPPSQLLPPSSKFLSLHSPTEAVRIQCFISTEALGSHLHGSSFQVSLPNKIENPILCIDASGPHNHTVVNMNPCCPSVEEISDQWNQNAVQPDIITPDFETRDGNALRKKLRVFPMEVIGHGDKEVVNAICDRIRSCGWDSSTELFLDERYSVHLSDLVVAKVVLKQRDVANASSFFRWACERIGYGTQSWHAYLVKLGDGRHFEQMWEVLNQMENSNCIISEETFCIFMKAYGASRQPGMAVSVFQKVLEYNDVKISIRLYTELMRAFFLSKHVEEARLCYSRILQDGLNLDQNAMTCLIRGFISSCNVPDAMSCFSSMLMEGFQPDIPTYNALIEGLCNINALNDAMKIFFALQKQGLRPTVSTFNIVIESLCRASRLDDAMDVFAGMRTTCLPNQSTFNTLLQGLFKSKSVWKAIEFFMLMENEGCLDANSFLCLSNGIRQAKQSQELCSFLKTLFAKYGYQNQEICVALLNSLCHLGSIDEAEIFFTNMVSEIKECNICSYAMMISCYCRLEEIQKAVDVLTRLKCEGGTPSCFCYTPLIAALLKGNRIADAMHHFEEMVNLGLEVNDITCNFLLQELCKQGIANDASTVCHVIMKNKLKIRSGVLFQFMKCLYNKGKFEEADSMMRDMYEMQCFPNRCGISQALAVREKMGGHVYC